MPPALLPRYSSFASYQEFAAFDAELTRQLGAGRWAAVTGPPPAADRLAPYQPSGYYQPVGTQQLWALSEPDNAWRGYFLPLEEALAHQAALRGSDQYPHLGCLLAAGLLGAAVGQAFGG